MDDARAAVIGREVEQLRLTQLLDAARNGISGALVVEGEPGIGKTTLLEWAVGQADGFRVVRCSGAQSEVEFPYAGLGQLLRPLEDGLADLSSAQAAALRRIMASGAGLTPEQFAMPPDRVSVGAATLALISAAAEAQPLLVIADDAHWLDQSSVDAMTFMSRRLLAEGVVVLFARRTGDPGTTLTDLPVLQVEGLAPAAAARILTTAGATSITSSRIEQLVAASNGNPLALLELPHLLSDEELKGLVPDHQPLPISDALLRAYSAQFDQLPDRCRRAAALVALLMDPDVRSTSAALREDGLSVADLAEAEDAGLIEMAPPVVAFRHPLARSAAAYSVPASWRRRAHAAIGRSQQGSTSITKRIESAWHFAVGVVGPDEQTARVLHEAAEAASTEVGWAAAASTYERAAYLSPDAADRYRRLVLAGSAAYHAGLTRKSEYLLDLAMPAGPADAEGAMLASYTQLRLETSQGQLGKALGTAADARDRFASSHPLEVARMLSEAAVAAVYRGDPAVAADHVQSSMDLVRDDPAMAATMTGLLGLLRVISGDFVTGRGLQSAIIDIAQAYAVDRSGYANALLFGNPLDLHYVAWFANALLLLDELALADVLARAALERAREASILSVVPQCLTVQASVGLRSGAPQRARVDLAQAIELAREMGLSLEEVNALAAQALVESRFADAEACRATAQAGLRLAAQQDNDANAGLLHLALGMLELGLGEVDAAIRELEDCQKICVSGGFLDFGHWQWPPELVEAYVRAGAFGKATVILDELNAQALISDRPILRAFALRCRGLIDNDYAAFDEAIDYHHQARRPFELARTHLCYGESLRRGRKRAAARHHFEQAWKVFEALGASRWAARASAQLAAMGYRVEGSGGVTAAALLTPQELQVAFAVASGATNREAAAQLFLSPKTIEYHLSRVFRKLQLTSRTQLVNTLGSMEINGGSADAATGST